MKKLLFLLTIVAFFTSCKKDEVFINGFSAESIKESHNIIKEAGLSPKSIEDITYVSFINDSVNAKYVGGVLGDAAWFAVFDSDGNEVESYTFPNSGSPEFCSFPLRYDMFGDILFLTVSQNNETYRFNQKHTSSRELLFYPYYCSSPALYVVNRKSKETVYKIETKEERGSFLSVPNNFGYVIMQREDLQDNAYYKMHFFNLTGELKWGREISKEEYGLRLPDIGTFINEEVIIFYSNIDSQHYRAINLRYYELKFTIDKIDLRMTGDLAYRPNVFYANDKWVTDLGKLFFVFSEFESRKIVDNPVTGAYHNESFLLGRYAYEIDPKDGSISSFGKY